MVAVGTLIAERPPAQIPAGAANAPVFLEIEIAERLSGAVADDETGVVGLLDRPWRREAACGWHRTIIA